MKPATVFLCYNHEDEREKEALLAHLGGLQHEGLLKALSDDQIGVGVDWEQAIDDIIAQAKAAILLITANFLNSKFIIDKEVPALLAQEEKGELIIYPIIARPCAWKHISWLRQIKTWPANNSPIWGRGENHVDERLAKIADEVVQIIGHQNQKSALAPHKILSPIGLPSFIPSALPPNPFGDQGRITDPTRFFGRNELLRQIFEELNKGINLSLVGESQIGKSSILSMICALSSERIAQSPAKTAYLNLEWVDDEDDFYEALCECLQVESSRGFKLTRALQGKKYLLCLDEIEKMTWEGFTLRVRSHLRGLADGQDAPLALVIASRSPLTHLFPDSPELDSPLAGICRQLEVKPFSPAVARVFLLHRLHDTGVTFTESQIDRLITESGGHPSRLQQAAASLYSHLTQGYHQ
jgi:hypothetical protein